MVEGVKGRFFGGGFLLGPARRKNFMAFNENAQNPC